LSVYTALSILTNTLTIQYSSNYPTHEGGENTIIIEKKKPDNPSFECDHDITMIATHRNLEMFV
jgi:hypothetical protein